MKRKVFLNKILSLPFLLLKNEKTQALFPVPTNYTSNPELKTIWREWPGTPLDQKGLFINHEFPFVHNFATVLKWMFQKNPQGKAKKADIWKKKVDKSGSFLNHSEDCVVWLGHATFFVRLDGIQLLIDPVFGNIPATKRLSDFPIDPTKFKNIDHILVSHAHYDHCDKDSLKTLAKLNPNATVCTGLKMNNIIQKWMSNAIQTAGWYQQYQINSSIEIFFVPSRHWSNRSLSDINETLWGGFVIRSKNKTIYFAGDSGYGNHFAQIGQLFPMLDLAMIGAGAYSPRWFMAPNHQDPQHAIKAFVETKAKTLIPFHYGTFDSADEPPSEPELLLTQTAQELKIIDKVRLLDLGNEYNFSNS